MTAVSPTYAQELKYAYFAHGLESVMQMVEGKLHGVLNGIDMERYDPASDPQPDGELLAPAHGRQGEGQRRRCSA